MLPALSKAVNSVYYFANINTSVKTLFEHNMNLKTVEIGANALLSYIERIKKTAEFDIKSRKFNSFQFIKTSQNNLVSQQGGYNVSQYHITPELVRFLSKYPPPQGKYAHDEKKTIYIYETWLEKTLIGTLSWADAAALFNAGINKKTDVQLFYAVKYISEYYRIIGGSMDKEKAVTEKKSVNMAKIAICRGNEDGFALKNKMVRMKAGDKIKGVAYTLLGTLKTENINEFMNSYFREMMGYGLPLTFPTDLLKDNDNFIRFGYAFLAGILQGDKKAIKCPHCNEVSEYFIGNKQRIKCNNNKCNKLIQIQNNNDMEE
jgi:CRISPR-associated protein Cst1